MANICNYEKYIVSPCGIITGQYGNRLKPQLVSGYRRVVLCNNFGKRPKMVHRLVAETFIPNPQNKPQVNHKNGIKTDNRVVNLEWVTISENAIHAVENGLFVAAMGEKQGHSKLTNKQVVDIFFDSRKQTQIAIDYGMDASCISDIKNKKTWKHITNNLN